MTTPERIHAMNRFTAGAACALLLASIPALAATSQGHASAAATAQASTAIDAVGVVRKVDAAQGKVTLQHEPIERLGWPAMTMAFRVRDAKLLEGLEPGRKVRFAFVQQGPAYVITAIE
jgi:Cu/Ag efflux protein CusF